MHPDAAQSTTDEVGVVVFDFEVIDQHAFGMRLWSDRLHDESRAGPRHDGVADCQVDRCRETLACYVERMLGRRRYGFYGAPISEAGFTSSR